MIGIDLFSGAGGLSLGAEMAGVTIRMAVEKDKAAALTYSKNHPNTIMLNGDIHELQAIPENLLHTDEQKIIIGGPPCQGFSLSNVRTRNKENVKNWLFEEFLRVTEMWHPDWIVLEKVLQNHRVTNGEVQKRLGVSRATAMRILQRLYGVLEPVGQGAGGYYRIRNY